jgi:hypothetical protein
LLDDHLADGVGEVVAEGAVVDDPLARTGLEDDAGDGGLATAGGADVFLGSDDGLLLLSKFSCQESTGYFRASAWGFWAAWGWASPP